METRIELGCPECGEGFLKPHIKELTQGIDEQKPSNTCSRHGTKSGPEIERYQLDRVAENIILSVITKREDQDRLRKDPSETIKEFQKTFSSLRKGKVEIDKSTKPVTLKWIPFDETPGS